MNYTMKELARKLDRTPQRLREVLKKEPFASMEGHIIRNENTNRVLYDEIVLEKLLEYYGKKQPTEKKETVDNRGGIGQEEIENPENPDNTPPPPQEKGDNTTRVLDILIEQLEREKQRCDILQKQYNDKEAERLYLFKQCEELRAENKTLNDKLLLMAPAAQEETETQAEGEEPAPAKMTFKEWFKQRFRK